MTYVPRNGLSGAIEGVVSWSGAKPARVATACGTIDNPTLRLGDGRYLRGALVYIEKVTFGRAIASYAKPAAVGGIVVKRGCVLQPPIQVLAPVPATIAIHGDARRAKVRVASADASKVFELQEGGVVQVGIANAGLTRVEADDGSLGAALVVAVGSPYYAITDDAGRFRIDELATGTYDVTFVQAAPTTVRADGTLIAGTPIVAHRSVHVDSAKTARVDVALH
jgi:hypothetical protein